MALCLASVRDFRSNSVLASRSTLTSVDWNSSSALSHLFLIFRSLSIPRRQRSTLNTRNIKLVLNLHCTIAHTVLKCYTFACLLTAFHLHWMIPQNAICIGKSLLADKGLSYHGITCLINMPEQFEKKSPCLE